MTSSKFKLLQTPKFRHAYLLTSLLFVIVLKPFLTDRVLGVNLIDAFLLVTLLTGAFSTIRSRREAMILTPLAVCTVVGWLASQFSGNASVGIVFLAICSLYFSVLIFLIMRTIFQPHKHVTTDDLLGSMVVYLLLGATWAMAYNILEYSVPGAFSPDIAGDEPMNFQLYLGFSFTTLTTLGYGNIVPADPRAAALASLEAIVGQLYVAIVIARLVSLHIANSMSSND
ncbi:MAG: hypothetical protein ACI97A_002739 [Planctomycetota bacterium]|jgi:hypothetical protein